MIHIPNQIQDFQFVKVLKNSKAAFESGTPRHSATDPSFVEHLKSGGNYGVSGDSERIIIDCDSDDLAQVIRSKLPRTFTVTSATKRAPHFYFRCKWTHGDLALTDWTTANPKTGNIGTVRRRGYVVGPFSQIDGRLYLVADASPVAEVSEEQVNAVLAPFIIERAKHEVKAQKEYDDELDFPILSIPGIRDGLQVHPVHGSKSGQRNLNVNGATNEWYCHACQSGGVSIQLLAVIEKKIGCWSISREGLRGEKFLETKSRAIELGLIRPSGLVKIWRWGSRVG